MLCPEGAQFQNDTVIKAEDVPCDKNKNVPTEVTGAEELNSFKTSKNWKKSITNFFRNQLRSTKSNDGDRPSGSKDKFEEKELSPEQKWQSLGKVFRRQSFAENWQRSPTQGESSQNKRHTVRKVLSTYFGKSNKCESNSNEY